MLDVKCFREEKKMKVHTGGRGPIRAGPTWRRRAAVVVDQAVVHVLLVLPRHLCMMYNQYRQHGQVKKNNKKTQCVCSVQQCACFFSPSAGLHHKLPDLALATFVNWTICFFNHDTLTVMQSDDFKKKKEYSS